MRGLFLPAIALMNKLGYTKKFMVLGLIYLIAIVVMFFSLYSNFSQVIYSTDRELQGIKLIKPLSQTMQTIQQYQNVTTLPHDTFRHNQQENAESKLTEKMMLVDNGLPYDTLLKPDDTRLNRDWRNIKTNWHGVKIKSEAWSVEQNLAAYVEILNQFQQFKETVADYYALTFDAGIDTHYLTDTVINKIPDVLEKLGQLHELSAATLTNKQLSDHQKNDIIVLIAELNESLSTVDLSLEKTGRANLEMQSVMISSAKEILRNVLQITNAVNADILSERFKLSSTDFFVLNVRAIDKIYAQSNEVLLPALESLLENRIQHAKKSLLKSIGSAFLLFIIAQYFFIGIYYAMMGNIRSLAHSAQKFADGNLSSRITLETEDELALVAENFNAMALSFQKLLAVHNANEAHLRSLVKAIPDLIWLKDKDGIYLSCNPTFESYIGEKEADLIGKTDYDFVSKELADSYWKYDQKIMAANKALVTEQSITFADDGREAFVETIKTPLHDIDGNIVGVLGIARNITKRKLLEIEQRIAAIAFESQEGIIITDENTQIIRVNNAFTTITGYSAEEAIGKTPRFLKSDRHDVEFYKEMWGKLQSIGSWQGEIWDRNKNGDIHPEWLTITAVKDDKEKTTHFVASVVDITAFKIAEEKIKSLAFYDPLTGLANRRKLEESLNHSIAMCSREKKQLAVLMMDLDRFKNVNDTLGHLAGDELLKQVAERINLRLRTTDMVARLGGDEFVVLLEDISQQNDAARVATEIVAALSVAFQLTQSDDVRIGASIGIALYPQHGETPELLMDNADIALYQAKDNGRGCFAYFSESLTLAARERLSLEARLRRGIEQGELRVYYQAQVDILTGKIIGAEALVRWQEPNEGLIAPYKFIPIAEETGLIISIGEWVLRDVCRQGKEWIDAGFAPIRLAVNVSPSQFKHCDMVELVTTVLAETNYPAEWLELELTESGLMEHQEVVIGILTKLRDLGIHLAIDDFGTGYSSLSYLKRFPLDVLKIDKSFIDDIPHHLDDMAITSAIISMGQTLGFKILAEGVETVEQLNFLKLKGCDIYQGFIKSKPIPADEFVNLLIKMK